MTFQFSGWPSPVQSLVSFKAQERGADARHGGRLIGRRDLLEAAASPGRDPRG